MIFMIWGKLLINKVLLGDVKFYPDLNDSSRFMMRIRSITPRIDRLNMLINWGDLEVMKRDIWADWNDLIDIEYKTFFSII